MYGLGKSFQMWHIANGISNMTSYGTENPCLLGVPEVRFVKPGHQRWEQNLTKTCQLDLWNIKMTQIGSVIAIT